MRLLQLQDDGSFGLVNRVGSNIPPYAILSHTWGPEEDEVSFRDMTHKISPGKASYRKLKFCATEAANDGLQFFWVDTCCIDKSSSAELQEAINSMFRWYRNAEKCYAYLEDVSKDSLAKNSLAFLKSRWFTRGWTLQELLAPKNVDFFTKEGDRIGSKSTLVKEIANATRIPTGALQERALSYFTVDQRLAWAENRETTREEDLAYSLMGIFDIHMPLIYGEGKGNAFKRLSRKIKNNRGGSKWEEDIELQPSFFGFVFQMGTALHETNKYFKLLMADSDKKGIPDLYAIKRTGTGDRHIEVHIISGASDYQEYFIKVKTPLCENLEVDIDFALTDWNGNGIPDLVMIKKNGTGTNSTEVHILSGAHNFQAIMLQIGTILPETDDTFAFAMARSDASSKPDLFAIKRSKTSSKTTEVHILSGATNFQDYAQQIDTSLPETDATCDFVVTDWNADGHLDLIAIKKSDMSGRCTQVHVLSGASKYKDFLLRAETPLMKSHGMFEFTVADWTRNGRPDLVAVRKTHTGTNATEVHVIAAHN
ncbi:hypothetical protein HBI73_072580 [Parastagonospora nodorum]|nr:hypothetical protein HBH42_054360 [Parastagonospora nodorum]KAH4992669.1 hypothetical protein HBI76_042900 [Parastagonospora nodorum]KAH5141532.1 hypothetical protein HBI73_072580 [Parastagonospora nodorum]KAH5242648.1 hypothetical protein HBI72_194150 [Parastagonospora nodorum]KAH5483428.1 hypothetical protein HBI31_177500 [Parastagonospora nodorum]